MAENQILANSKSLCLKLESNYLLILHTLHTYSFKAMKRAAEMSQIVEGTSLSSVFILFPRLISLPKYGKRTSPCVLMHSGGTGMI